MNTSQRIKAKCKKLEELLLHKNEKYGNSALEPLNVFSKANAVSGIKVRRSYPSRPLQLSQCGHTGHAHTVCGDEAERRG